MSDNPYQALGFNYDQEYDPSQPTEEQQQGQPGINAHTKCILVNLIEKDMHPWF